MRFAFPCGAVAIDQEHGGGDRQVNDGIALIVDVHRVGIEVGLDQVLAGDGKIDVELLLRRGVRRDLLEGNRSARLAVGQPIDRHVADREGAVVLHADLHPPLHARGAYVFLRLQRGNRQVGPAGFLRQVGPAGFLLAVDEADLGVVVVELREAFFQLVGFVPLAGAEVREQVDDPPLACIFAQQLPDGLEGRQRLGGGLRDGNRFQCLAQALAKIGVDRLLLEIGPGAAVAAARARQPQEGEALRLAGAGQRLAQPLNRALGLIEGRLGTQILGHRVAIVQEHDMVRALRRESCPSGRAAAAGPGPAPPGRSPPCAARARAVA